MRHKKHLKTKLMSKIEIYKENKYGSYPFRIGRVKPASEKRISKVCNKKLKDFNPLYAFLTVIPVPRGFWTTMPFIHSVIWRFFMVQYNQKIHLSHYPVKNVDNELDTKVPFEGERIGVYLDFIYYWIRPIAMIQKRFGIIEGTKLSGEYLRYIKLAYDQAYKMYTYSMTTTVRPQTRENRVLTRTQKADPHFLCVPSLHIAIICLNVGFYKMLFERENFTQQEKDNWNKEIFEYGMEIAETVLYVKQHSVNCIPAALYMMTKITPELFSPMDAVNIINSFFNNVSSGENHVSPENGEKIREHMHFVYERFLLEGALEEDWRSPVIRWLDGYHPYLQDRTDF